MGVDAVGLGLALELSALVDAPWHVEDNLWKYVGGILIAAVKDQASIEGPNVGALIWTS